jgi:hypothetical protein
MEPTQEHQQRSIDLTGLSEEAIRAVELLVSRLRGAEFAGLPTQFSSHEDWANAVREWAESHPRRDALADDSRETIYARDRDE